MLLLLLLLVSLSCGLNCSESLCSPRCSAPACEVQCESPAYCYPLECRTRCNTTFFIDTCPLCETVCNPLVCFLASNRTSYTGCQPLCNAPNCGWNCQCNGLSCQYSGAGGMAVASLAMVLMFLLI